MAGFGEGLGAFFQGFSSVYAPRVEKAKDRKENEKDRAERRADREADRAERQADRAQSQANFQALLQERKDVRAEDKLTRSTERAEDKALRIHMAMWDQGNADRASDTAWDRTREGYKIQAGYRQRETDAANKLNLYTKEIDTNRQLALRSLDVKERTEAQAKADALTVARERERRNHETLSHIRDRYEKVVDQSRALQENDQRTVLQATASGLEMAERFVKAKEDRGERVDPNFVRKFVDQYVDHIRAKITPGTSDKEMAIEANTLGEAMALSRNLDGATPEQMEAIMSKVNSLPSIIRMFREENPTGGAGDKPPEKKASAYENKVAAMSKMSGATADQTRALLAERGEYGEPTIAGETLKLKPPEKTKEPELSKMWNRWAAQNPADFQEAYLRFETHPSLGTKDVDQSYSYKVERFRDWMIDAVKHYSPYTAYPDKGEKGKNKARVWADGVGPVLEFIKKGTASDFGGLRDLPNAPGPKMPADVPPVYKAGRELLNLQSSEQGGPREGERYTNAKG